MPVNVIMKRISIRCFVSIIPNRFFIANVVPVLVLFIEYNDIKEKVITRVFIIPNNMINCCSEFFLIKLPNVAACPEPNPGRKLQSGADKSAEIIGFFRFIFGFVIICSGIFVLFFIDKTIFDAPNNPDNNGSRGWFIVSWFIDKPKNPVSKKTIIAFFFFFSLYIKNIDNDISINGIIFSIVGKNFFNKNIDGMMIIAVIIIAVMLPMFDKYTASNPFFSFNIRCPGKTPNSVSVSGHPRKIEGMKSMNVWVMDIDVIKVKA